MSQFAFLRREWADVFDSAARAERLVNADARASCFYARRALEIAVAWPIVIVKVQSWRSVWAGSIAAARRAGSQHAAAPTMVRIDATTAIVTGS
jgi:hypothetical protein